MTRIRLPRGEWFYDGGRRLGRPGGFGEVFEGEGADGSPVAVKRLKVTAGQAAHRELEIADQLAGHSFPHVLEVLDCGEDAENGFYFVVMPRAERSLADAIVGRGQSTSAEAAAVLLDIVSGLLEVSDIVHRDLKPANILFHDGHWKIADFGIAKFVEDATSRNTVKDALTPPFAAPEQWRAEHSDAATDVYALSCIAYVLLTGEPPFVGPTTADYQQQHLHAVPPPLPETVDPRLRAIVAAGLRKVQAGRPRTGRVAEVLKDIVTNPPAAVAPGIQALRAANANEAQRVSAAQADASRLQRLAAERQALVDAGEEILEELGNRLRSVIQQDAAEAKLGVARGSVRAGKRMSEWKITLGNAKIEFESQAATPPTAAFPMSKWEAVAIGLVQVTQNSPNQWQHGATLWYMRRRPEDGFRWFEVSYKRHALVRGTLIGPFPIQALGKNFYEHADAAAGPGMHAIKIESGPTPIDDEDTDQFIDRWVTRFAEAYKGRLRPF